MAIHDAVARHDGTDLIAAGHDVRVIEDCLNGRRTVSASMPTNMNGLARRWPRSSDD
jgi:hypothetical protein